jgi:C1A family cysteine protease
VKSGSPLREPLEEINVMSEKRKRSFFTAAFLLPIVLGFISCVKATEAEGTRGVGTIQQSNRAKLDYLDNVLCLSDIHSQKNDPTIPPSFDWRERNILTPVKHQMNLGSCGVFSAVAVFEALIKKKTRKDVDLSEQHIINSSADWVPSGISAVDAMKFMKDNGIVLEESLPYEDRKTENKPAQSTKYRLHDYQYVITDKMPLIEKISTIKEAVFHHGPVATNMIFYQDLDLYRSGIYVYDGKSKEEGGHWVVITGWRDDSKVKNGGYWICRNSWGPGWGESGYFKIAYGECGIDDFWFVYGIY